MNPSAYNAAICAASSLASGAVGFAASADYAVLFIAILAFAFAVLSAMANTGRSDF